MKKLLAMLLAAAMTIGTASVALADGADQVSSMSELKQAVGQAPDHVPTVITLTGNISGVRTEDIVTIPDEKNIILDMAGHSITVDSSFSGRPFVNNGSFTIKGNGTVDVSDAGANGYGTVNNYGTLVVEDGYYVNLKESNASNFYNRNGGTATFINPTIDGGGGCIATEVNTKTEIHGGTYSNETYPAIENRGDMLITAGTFTNTSCSSCDGRWGYTIRSGEQASDANLVIKEENDSVKVTGVQGGLAVVGGTASVHGGNYTTVACSVHDTGSSAHYALYIAGEDYPVVADIMGGTYTSASKVAAVFGNENTGGDGGNMEHVNVKIYDGNFISGDANGYILSASATLSDPQIIGGNFYKKPGLTADQDKAGANVVVVGNTGTYTGIIDYVPEGSDVTVDESGNVIVTGPELPPEEEKRDTTGGDYFGNAKWAEVKRAIAAAEEGDTIKVSATGLPWFPSSVARALKGRDITLEVRKNGVTYSINGLEIGAIEKIWYEFDQIDTELLTVEAE